jgi:putative endonuclease
MYYVYVLYSVEYKKIYIGFTSDLEKRIASHNHPLNKGYTAKFKPWVLIYSETYDSKKLAMLREKQLKTARGRNFIKNFIQI